MKRTSEIPCMISECYHQDAKTVSKKDANGKETGETQNYKESTRVTAEYMGGKISLNALDPNFKCETGKPGILQVEEELLPVKYLSHFGEKNGTGWVILTVLGFKVSPAR